MEGMSNEDFRESLLVGPEKVKELFIVTYLVKYIQRHT